MQLEAQIEIRWADSKGAPQEMQAGSDSRAQFRGKFRGPPPLSASGTCKGWMQRRRSPCAHHQASQMASFHCVVPLAQWILIWSSTGLKEETFVVSSTSGDVARGAIEVVI